MPARIDDDAPYARTATHSHGLLREGVMTGLVGAGAVATWFLLVDLHSRNGCFVNGKRAINARLETGAEIRLGTARLIYRVDYSSAVQKPS